MNARRLLVVCLPLLLAGAAASAQTPTITLSDSQGAEGNSGFTNFTVPAVGPWGADFKPARSLRDAAAGSLFQRKLVPSTHMRWRMTPSLRASATLAFLVPRRLATAIAQALRPEKRTVRVSITLAAS